MSIPVSTSKLYPLEFVFLLMISLKSFEIIK